MEFRVKSEFERTVELQVEDIMEEDEYKDSMVVDCIDKEGNEWLEVEKGTELANRVLENIETSMKEENIDSGRAFWDSLKIEVLK